MKTRTAKIRTMPDIRKIVLRRLNELDLSRYALVQKLNGKVPARTVYQYLDGPYDKGGKTHPAEINTAALGHILDALQLTVSKK